MRRLVLFAGTTATASIDGISAAGARPGLLKHTPGADAELLSYGSTVRSPVVPVSPTGCPTPAVMTRAVRESLGFKVTVVDAGLQEPTAAPTVTVGARSGGDIRESDPVPTAPGAYEAARQFGRQIPDTEVVVAETIPGGTTTALGVLTALGERESVSSSLADNPVARKREVVTAGLDASNLDPGGAGGDPKLAMREMGDPVLATAAGFAHGAVESGTAVTFGGATQLLAVVALLRHAGLDTDFPVETTSFVSDDQTADTEELAADLNVSLTVTDPGFGGTDHPAMAAYTRGEAKEGVGMGAALAFAERAGVSMTAVREQVRTVYDRVTGKGGEE